MTPLFFDCDETFESTLDYHERSLPASRREASSKLEPSGRQKIARQSRYSRQRGGAANLQNGIHRRGRKPIGR